MTLSENTIMKLLGAQPHNAIVSTIHQADVGTRYAQCSHCNKLLVSQYREGDTDRADGWSAWKVVEA